jgi:hypothetical protein
MKPNNQPQDRQQILIDLYLQYLKQEITTGSCQRQFKFDPFGYSFGNPNLTPSG